MNLLRIILLALGISGCFLAHAQERGPAQSDLARDFRQEKTEIQLNQKDSLIAWQEQVLLHLDKTTMDPNTPIFFKGYVLTGPKRVRATLSQVLKVELLRSADSVVVATQYHRLENGTTSGVLTLPDKIETGRYHLRAYTRWMQNYGADTFFTKEIRITSNRKPSDMGDTGPGTVPEGVPYQIGFYPEGGRLVGGLDNRLLIKAVTDDGRLKGLNGVITNSSGDPVGPVTAFENGIMAAYLIPDPDQRYTFRTPEGREFEIPSAVAEGYVLHLNNLDREMLKFRVQATPEMSGKEIWIKGTMNGLTYFMKQLEWEGRDMTLEIPKKGIPFGTMHVSLIDAEGEVWTSRPVLIDPVRRLNIGLTPLEEEGRAEERAYKLRVTNAEGEPVSTTLALSATHMAGKRFPGPYGDGDFLWEMSGTDLLGFRTVRTDRFIRDLELLTAGAPGLWKDDQVPTTIAYPFQQGLDLIGYAYDLNNRLLRDAEVQLLIKTADDVIIRELRTDTSGKVEVDNLQLTGETELIFRTEGEDSKTRLVKVVPIQEAYDEQLNRKSVLAFAKLKNQEPVASSPWEPLDSEDMIELNEVKVFEDKIERPRAMAPTYGMEAIPSRTKVQDLERPRFLFQLFAEIPGISVTGGPLDAPTISINSTYASLLDQAGPLWVIDGFIVGNSPGVDPTWGLTAWDIDRIEFFVGAEAAMYGSRAAKGVIMIYTRNGSELDFINRKEGVLYFQGYSEGIDFEAYADRVAKRPRRFAGKPTTVYWNPEIKTDANGEATVRFKLPFETSVLRIKASTITPEGLIASSQEYFE